MFHLHLFSNVRAIGHDNTLANFKTSLAAPIRLERDYQMALTEVSFTSSFFNLATAAYVVVKLRGSSLFQATEIPPGRYTRTGLIALVNRYILRDCDEIARRVDIERRQQANTTLKAMMPALSFDKETFLVQPDYKSLDFFELLMDNQLRRLLGSTSAEPIRGALLSMNKEVVRPQSVRLTGKIREAVKAFPEDDASICGTGDMTGGLRTIYITTDILRHVNVGRRELPLLRAVHVNEVSHPTVQQYYSYPNPEFKDLSVREFSEITISLTSESGQLVPFKFGRVWLSLLFRPARSDDDDEQYNHGNYLRALV